MLENRVTFQALPKSETPTSVTSSCGDFAAIPVITVRGEYDAQFRGIACMMLGETHLFDQGFEVVFSKCLDKLNKPQLHRVALELIETLGLDMAPSHLTTAQALKVKGVLHESVTDSDLIRVWCEQQINPFAHSRFVDGRGYFEGPSMKAKRTLLAWFSSQFSKEVVCS